MRSVLIAAHQLGIWPTCDGNHVSNLHLVTPHVWGCTSTQCMFSASVTVSVQCMPMHAVYARRQYISAEEQGVEGNTCLLHHIHTFVLSAVGPRLDNKRPLYVICIQGNLQKISMGRRVLRMPGLQQRPAWQRGIPLRDASCLLLRASYSQQQLEVL